MAQSYLRNGQYFMGSSRPEYRPDQYQYGGDSMLGKILPIQRRILKPESQSAEFVGYDDTGRPIYDVVTTPAELGPVERGPSLMSRMLGGLRNAYSAATEDPQAMAGALGGAMQGQIEAAAAGGRVWDPETQQMVEFDPMMAAVGTAPGGVGALMAAEPGAAVLGSFGSAIKEYPALRKIAPYLTDEEKGLFENPQWRKQGSSVIQTYKNLPSVKEMASVATAGGAKRGWYKESYDAIQDIFANPQNPDDPERFTALLAALSPQTSVESNLKNALSVWKNWLAKGRPNDPAKILQIMGESVEGDKGAESVLGAWRNNSYRALTVPNAKELLGSVGLSGPKVQSFMRNLAGDFNEVTNDAWMAKLSSIDQGLFGGAKRASFADEFGDIGIKGPGYLAQNAKQRQAAEMLGWSPAEVQETGWSFGKTLSDIASQPNYVIRSMEQGGIAVPEMYRGLGSQTAESALRGGYLTDAAVGGTPAFGDLVRQGEYARLLQGAGYTAPPPNLMNKVFTSPYDRVGVGPEDLAKTSEGRDLIRAARRLDMFQRRSDAYSALKTAQELKSMAKTTTEQRRAAQRIAQASRMLQRSASEMPLIPVDKKFRQYLK